MNNTYNITQIDDVIELLVSSSLTLKKKWDKYYRKEYKGDRERYLYIDMMEISAFVVKMFQQHKLEDLKLFFERVEIILNDADSEVTNLMLAGLIEGIQQICPYQNIDMRHEFDNWLLPLTKNHWDELTKFYNFDLWNDKEKVFK